MSKNNQNWTEIESYEDLSANKQLFADWLATPQPFRSKIDIFEGATTQGELAELLGVRPETLSRWKYKDKFIDIVQKRKQRIAGADALNRVIDSLIVRASGSNGDNKAAEMFLNWFYNKDFTQGGTSKQVNKPNYGKRAAEIAEDHLSSEGGESSEGKG